MITEPALAIAFALMIEDLTAMFHPYLALSEGIELARRLSTGTWRSAHGGAL